VTPKGAAPIGHLLARRARLRTENVSRLERVERPALAPVFLVWSPHLNRTAEYRDASTAIDAARRAFARGDVATAERLCAEVLASPPEDGRAWALLTETALQRERLGAAMVCANRAAALLPGDSIAHTLRAKCLILSGDLSQALKAAERASEVIGAAPEALDALGAIFGMLGQHQKAAKLLRRAVAARPDVPQYLVNLAATERMLGLLADADTHCGVAIAQNPGYAIAHYIRSDLRVQSAEHNHIAEMESLLEGGGLDWRSTVLLRYALAKECEDIAAHEQAFAHVALGARLLRQNVDYDVHADLAVVERSIATQNRSWLAALARTGPAAAPVFVCGLPRTGTTLVERIIAAHSAVDSAGETGIFPAEAARLDASLVGSAPDFDRLGERYLRTVSEVFAPTKKPFVDKTLHNYLCCGLIHAALPQAKVILMLRGPMATAWALYKALFTTGYLFSYELADLADYYLAYRRLVEHWRDTIPPDALLTVTYEDVVRCPAEQSARILDFLGLPWEDATLRFHESRAPSATASAVQVRRPIYATSIEAWRRHARSLAPFRERLLRCCPTFDVEDLGPT
jgi:tetratricopeptide (TPR) repeat protein